MSSEAGGENLAGWELSKENIQPLKQGRKVAKLANVLQPRDEESSRLLLEERQEFETELRTYNGPDPLDPWFRYIAWVEQSYPKGGKEGNIIPLLETCIKQFKDSKEAHSDPRFLQVWLKYAAVSGQALEVYSSMYKNGMCTQQPGLYEAWAWQLECEGNYVSALKVFAKGKNAMTDREAREGLQARQKEFQARVDRRKNGEDISPEEIEEQEQRTSLARLKVHGKHGKVSSIRVGAAKLGGPGRLIPAQSDAMTRPPVLGMHNSNRGAGAPSIKIYQDENEPAEAMRQPATASGVVGLPSRSQRKENEMSAGRWNENKAKTRQNNVPFSKISHQAKPAFIVHEDENDEQAARSAHKLAPGESNVLSARKLDKEDSNIHCPVALFEPPDPTKQPMYCKSKVYQGSTEFSFEELRSIKWQKKEDKKREAQELARKEKELREKEEEMDRKKRELMEFEAKLKRDQEALMKMYELSEKAKHSASEHPPRIPQVVVTSSSAEKISDERKLIEESPPLASVAGLKRSYDTAVKLTESASTRPCSLASPQGRKMSCGSHASPTVNTIEAMAVMEQLWSSQNSCQNSSTFANDTDKSNPAIASSAPPFQIYTEPEGAKEENNPVQEEAAVPFQIFCDDQPKPLTGASKINRKDRVAMLNNLEDKENYCFNDENQENIQPPGFMAPPPSSEREKTGILTTAANVEWMPLEEQESMLEEDETKSVPRRPVPNNATLMLPDPEEFERMAKMSSTPFTGRCFVPEEDDNTCDVNVVFKVPSTEPAVENAILPPPARPTETGAAPMAFNALSPIVETSREYKTSSSSSSAGDFTAHGLTKADHSKSHWGNTGTSMANFKSTINFTGTGHSLCVRTPGPPLGASCTSGYMGDKSSIASNVKPTFALARGGENFRAMSSQEFREKLDSADPDENARDDQTECLPDMMSEFKQILNRQEEAQNESAAHVSRIESQGRNFDLSSAYQSKLNITDVGKANMSQNMKGSMSVANEGVAKQFGLDKTRESIFGLTGQRPQLDLTAAPEEMRPQLDLTAPGDDLLPQLDLTAPTLESRPSFKPDSLARNRLAKPESPLKLNLTQEAPPSLELTGSSLARLDITDDFKLDRSEASLTDKLAAPAKESFLDLTENEKPAGDFGGFKVPLPITVGKTIVIGDLNELDPFSQRHHDEVLASLTRPLNKRKGYISQAGKMPAVRTRSTLQLGPDRFIVDELKGEGGFAKVFSARREDNDLDSTIAGIDAVLKVQKPANDWEWYICNELAGRLVKTSHAHLASAFMSIPRNFSFADGSIFVTYHQQLGTLLDFGNKLQLVDGKMTRESFAMYFLIEMLSLIEALHSVSILHGDIKADNFLLQGMPQLNEDAETAEEMFNPRRKMSLQLIDFGRAVDLSVLPKDVAFHAVVKTEGLKCVEMREGRAWREHLDYYGIAAVAYTILFGSYMDIVKVGDNWKVKGNFKRWWQTRLWQDFFHAFLNISGPTKESLPSLCDWRMKLQETFFEKGMVKELHL